MHSVELIQILNGELAQDLIRLGVDLLPEVLLSVLPCLDLCLKKFLQGLNSFDNLRVTFLMLGPLLSCLLNDLVLNHLIVIFKVLESRL